MGEDSCSKSSGFESQHCARDGHFSHLFVVRIVLFVWKDKNKQKRGRELPIFKKNWIVLWKLMKRGAVVFLPTLHQFALSTLSEKTENWDLTIEADGSRCTKIVKCLFKVHGSLVIELDHVHHNRCFVIEASLPMPIGTDAMFYRCSYEHFVRFKTLCQDR